MTVTVPAAKAGLINQLQAHPDLGDVAIHWGLKPEVPHERERMYILGAQDLVRERPYEGSLSTERYQLRVLIEVHLAERSQQLVEERMWELYELLERAVDDDRELGGVVQRATVTGAEEPESGIATDQGWVVRVVATITIQAHV